MIKHGKRYKAAREKVDRTHAYPLKEALTLVKETAGVKFDATVELHVRLGIDPAKAEQTVRTSVVFPHSTGRTMRVAVFTTPSHEAAAKTAGADLVGGKDLIEEIKKTGKADFDVAVATPDIMKELASVARILGQKGLMPSPKNETVSSDVARAVKELKGGKLTIRNDGSGNVHAAVGKISMSDEQLTQNITTLMDAVKKAKPSDLKGTYLKSITLTSTMGPGIRVTV